MFQDCIDALTRQSRCNIATWIVLDCPADHPPSLIYYISYSSTIIIVRDRAGDKPSPQQILISTRSPNTSITHKCVVVIQMIQPVYTPCVASLWAITTFYITTNTAPQVWLTRLVIPKTLGVKGPVISIILVERDARTLVAVSNFWVKFLGDIRVDGGNVTGYPMSTCRRRNAPELEQVFKITFLINHICWSVRCFATFSLKTGISVFGFHELVRKKPR